MTCLDPCDTKGPGFEYRQLFLLFDDEQKREWNCNFFCFLLMLMNERMEFVISKKCMCNEILAIDGGQKDVLPKMANIKKSIF